MKMPKFIIINEDDCLAETSPLSADTLQEAETIIREKCISDPAMHNFAIYEYVEHSSTTTKRVVEFSNEHAEQENKYEIHEVYICEMCLEAWDEDDLTLKDGNWICPDCLKHGKHLHDDLRK
jgi:formylmethanofuran dehydrogenase subunit E